MPQVMPNSLAETLRQAAQFPLWTPVKIVEVS
jgi:hypothetical protein